jgi:hypothetical protein
MKTHTKKRLLDALTACRAIETFMADSSFADYERNLMLRSAVERQFEIIGEALHQAETDDPELADLMPWRSAHETSDHGAHLPPARCKPGIVIIRLKAAAMLSLHSWLWARVIFSSVTSCFSQPLMRDIASFTASCPL